MNIFETGEKMRNWAVYYEKLAKSMLGILLLMILGCNAKDEQKSSAQIKPSTKKQHTVSNWAKIDYYQHSVVDMRKNIKYLKQIKKEQSKGINHIRLYYNKNNQIAKEESYNKTGYRIKFTNFIYKNNKKIREEGFDADSYPIFIRFYDDQGKIIKEQNFVEGELNSYIIYSYDKKGNLVKEELFTQNNMKISYKIIECNDKNQPYKEKSFSRNKVLTHYHIRSYDDGGMLESLEIFAKTSKAKKMSLTLKTYFNQIGEITKVEQYFDDKMELVEEYKADLKWKTTFYDKTGKPQHYEIYQYNEEGVQIKIQSFSSDGTLQNEKKYDLDK